MNNLGCMFAQDAESRGSDPTFGENSVSINVPRIIDAILFRFVQIGFLFAYDVKIF